MDPISKRRMYLSEVVPPGPRAGDRAERVRTHGTRGFAAHPPRAFRVLRPAARPARALTARLSTDPCRPRHWFLSRPDRPSAARARCRPAGWPSASVRPERPRIWRRPRPKGQAPSPSPGRRPGARRPVVRRASGLPALRVSTTPSPRNSRAQRPVAGIAPSAHRR
jgi:hypothetical protein